jgi:hypothetical protein
VDCVLILDSVSFVVQKLLNLMQFHLSILAFIFWANGFLCKR